MFKHAFCCLSIVVVVALSGCGSDNSATMPTEYSNSQLPAEPPAMENQGGGLTPAEPPKLDL